MGWTPTELEEQPAAVIRRWFDYLAAEAEAQRKAQDRACRRGHG